MISRFLFCLAIILFLPNVSFAAEQIQRFTVEAELSKDRLFQVRETIEYDFGDAERHGIFRFIPDEFIVNGQRWYTGLRFLGAALNQQPVPYRMSSRGVFKEIRIGDPAITLTGQQAYSISYQANRVVRDEADHQELYWNVTGNDWEIPIQEASFTLKGPMPTQVECRTGLVGSRRADCEFVTGKDGITRVVTKEPLRIREGLTVALKYPLGTFEPRPWQEVFIERLVRHAWWLTPIGIGILMFCIWFIWGRDPKGRGVVIPEYEPPKGYNPLEVGAMLDETILPRAVTGTIINLAKMGYLTVVFPDTKTTTMKGKEQEMTFKKIEGMLTGDLSVPERELYNGLFGQGRDAVTPNALKGTFYSAYNTAVEETYVRLIHRGLIARHPTLTRGLWLFFAVGVASTIVFIGVLSRQPLWYLSAPVSFLIVLLFGYQMPRVTKEGAVLREHIQGFKYFLSVTEKERLAFFDAPERTPEQFSEYLPYAIALGVEKQWAKQFSGIELQPAYFASATAVAWTPIAMERAIEDVTRLSAYSSFYRPPETKSSAFSSDSDSGGSSGGSSFSGGGFGGGGGGSW